MSAEDYDILNILGNTISSTTYKVRHKTSKETLIWKTVDCENISAPDIDSLIEKLKKRKELRHPNLLKFYDHILQKEPKVIFIVGEYCENGSLRGIIESCLANNTRLSEEIVCKILYQIAFTIKTTDRYNGKLTTKEIFLDDDFNIKLLNFKVNFKNKGFKEPKMSHLGLALYEACTLKPFDKNNYESSVKGISGMFTSSLLSLIMCMIKDSSELKKNINKVLCHPTVLMKSSQWVKEKSFLEVETDVQQKSLYQDENIPYTLKLERLRDKELALQVRQQQLNEKEHKLATREKKIILMEQTVREKLQQAELYLKRCRETKSISSGSTKSNFPSQSEKKAPYENLDSTYVSCGDSILLPTSAKLNVSKIIKPAPFMRTLSERRIRFKGHSPLKEIDMNKRRSIKQPKSKKEFKRNSEWLTCSEDTDKSSKEGSLTSVYNKSRQLFPEGSVHKNDRSDIHCKPITWTEENKKHAFGLLKVMNNDKENQCVEVKHTYL